jgi:hypothetical protein
MVNKTGITRIPTMVVNKTGIISIFTVNMANITGELILQVEVIEEIEDNIKFDKGELLI